eukprot:59306-Pyramimonas_sp.AAC.1
MKLQSGALPIRNGPDGCPLQTKAELADSVQAFFAGIEGGTLYTERGLCVKYSEDNRDCLPLLECPAENLMTRDQLRFSFSQATSGKAGGPDDV